MRSETGQSAALQFEFSHLMDPVGKLSEEQLWEIVRNRDPRYYASFVYGVRSTKTYCRPTCPSRRPDRKNVVFFSDSGEARGSGFRACLRCRPDDGTTVPCQVQLVENLCNYIDENYNDKITLRSLAQKEGINPFHLQRVFKKITGITPREYLESSRMRRLKMSLKRGEAITSSTYKAGYKTSGWLYSQPNTKLGMSPQSYKSGGEGLDINYVIVDCSLGRLLVGATEKGICAVSLGDSDEKLVAFLRSEYPMAVHTNVGRANGLSEWVGEILEYIDKGKNIGEVNLPLDLRATAFQWKVLKELQKIPFGEVRSYSEIARRVGCPDGSRAVANVCASNRAALVIPCHRVVRKNGNLGGYRWGIERKKLLLRKEGVTLPLSSD